MSSAAKGVLAGSVVMLMLFVVANGAYEMGKGEPEVVQGTPSICVEALNTARHIAGLNADFAMLTAETGDIAADAIWAAGTGDTAGLEHAADRQFGVTARMSNLNDQLAPAVEIFNQQADACEAG